MATEETKLDVLDEAMALTKEDESHLGNLYSFSPYLRVQNFIVHPLIFKISQYPQQKLSSPTQNRISASLFPPFSAQSICKHLLSFSFFKHQATFWARKFLFCTLKNTQNTFIVKRTL